MDFLRGGIWNGRSKTGVESPNVSILWDIYECWFNSDYSHLARDNVEREESEVRGAHTQWKKKKHLVNCHPGHIRDLFLGEAEK